MSFGDTGWMRYVDVTLFSSAVGAGGLTGYTFPFHHGMLTPAARADIAQHAKADLSDLRFEIGTDGKSPLDPDLHHRAKIGGTDITLGAELGSANLSDTIDQTLRVWYGNPAATLPSGPLAYTAGHAAFLVDGGPGTDRVTGAAFGTALGGLTAGDRPDGPSAYAGSATTFDGINDGINGGATPFTAAAVRTVMVWIKPDAGSLSADRELFRVSDVGAGEAWVFRLAGSASGALRLAVTSGSVTSTLTPVAGQWNLVGVRHDGANLASAEFFCNGVLENASGSSVAINTSPGTLFLGTNQGSGNYLKGAAARWQGHVAERNLAWLNHQYLAFSNPSAVAINQGSPVGLGGVAARSARSRRLRRRRST